MVTDERNFAEWMLDLFEHPFSCGAKGIFFFLVALPSMIVCGVLGLSILPPGRYPRIVLVLPGLILGFVFLYIYGYIVYNLPSALAIPLSIVLSVIAFYFAYNIGSEIVRQLMAAI